MVPRISVVLPVWNGQNYLHECIRSVLQQTLSEFEMLIGDDGSTDSSPQIIQAFRDPRIRYYRHGQNVGLFKNLNDLLVRVRTPLVRFLCQDDVLEPNCLETEKTFFDVHPDIGMSFCKSIVIDPHGKIIEYGTLGDLPEVMSSMLSIQHFFYHGCIPGNLSTVCVRTRVLQEVGFFDESFYVSGDYELWIRIVQKYPLGVIHKHLVRLRRHPEQLSRKSDSGVRFIRETRRIRQALWPLLPLQIHSRASYYKVFRFNVLDTHHALRCLIAGKFRDFLEIVSIMGTRDLASGLMGWLLTLNNRIYRPKPEFVLDT